MRYILLVFSFLLLVEFSFAIEIRYSEEKCYKGKNSKACLSVGEWYYKLKKYEKSAKYLERACNLKNGEACFRLSKLYLYGEGVEGDFDKTFELVKKSCRLNYIEGCVEEGVIYKIEGKFNKAISILNKTCKLNNGRGCNELGDIYFIGLGVDKNEEKAKELYHKACKLKYSYGCLNEANFYSGKKALEIYKKACNLNNNRGCYQVGYFYEKGNYIQKDIKKAKTFYKKACDLGHEKACTKLKMF